MFSRRSFLRCLYGGVLLLFLPSCDQPETELALETLGPILPYIQNVKTDRVTVLWQSADKEIGTVEVYEDNGSLVTKVSDSPVSFHEIEIRDLSEDTLYYYQAKEGKIRVGPLRSFRTALPEGSKTAFSFIAIGDSGYGTQPQYKVAAQMLEYASNASFLIHMGDVIYDGYEGEYRSKYFEPYRSFIHRIPFYPVIGDHDLVDDGKPFYKYFSLPKNNIEGSEDYFSFNFGNALFIGLNSNTIINSSNIDSQVQFLERTLQESTQTWKFIYLSHSILTTALGRGSKPSIGRIVSPIAERFGVQIIFGGDVHAYERFFPRVDYTENGDPVTYVTTGGGGADLRDLAGSPDEAVGKSAYHFVLININDMTLTGTAIDFNGNTIDSFELSPTGN
ncbi:MAG: metallophosphoesterase family protein [SAR324 cluster bacterium]|nr:metallophosphoesterase family protein [SAR324 cluster bacterium]